MNCKNCGAQIDEGYAFCASCGTAVENAAPVQDIQPEQPIQQPAQQPVEPIYVMPEEPAPAQGKGYAIASLVLGIVSFFCFAIVAGTLAIIFGAIARNKGQKGMATAGLVCGIIGIALWIIMLASGLGSVASLASL